MQARFALSVLALALTVSVANADTTVWLSDSDTAANLTTAVGKGEAGSFDIWIQTDQAGVIDGVSLDIMAMGDAIKFTGVELLGQPGRWGHPYYA